jgi:Flp pilus assembly protein TadB
VSTEHERRTEEREVRSDNPDLSPEANRLLTEELREALGTERVRVPTGSSRPLADGARTRSPLVGTLIANRPLIVVTLLAALVVGAAVSLATGSWWAVVAVVGAHAIGTLVVATAAIQLTTQTEHASPEVAARLEEEGVADPDRVLSDLVEGYSPATGPRGTADVLSSGHNERTVRPEDDPAKAAAEQRTALTPSSLPGPAAGSGSAVAALPWWVVVGVMAISLAAPIAGDSPRLWVVPAIVWPLCLAWIALQRRMQRHDRAEEANEPDDPGPPAHGSLRRLLPIYAAIVVATLVFTILMGVVVGAL